MASSKSDHVLSREEYPEPQTKAGFPALVRQVLEQPGGVHRIVMERGQPVRVWRWTEKNDLMEGDRTLDMALASADIIEYVNPDETKTAPEELFHMLSVLNNEKHVAVCWATGRDQTGLFRRWLRVDEQGVPYDEDHLCGIPVERLKSLPEDTLLLCGAPHVSADIADVTLAIKLAIELREHHDQEVVERNADRVGHPAQERRRPTGASENGARGDDGQGWVPPSFLRSRFGGSS
jgi:hypothetical protein